MAPQDVASHFKGVHRYLNRNSVTWQTLQIQKHRQFAHPLSPTPQPLTFVVQEKIEYMNTMTQVIQLVTSTQGAIGAV